MSEEKPVDALARRLANTYVFRDDRFAFVEDVAHHVVEFGWLSPEEAKAREAAARREALLEAADWIESDHPNARGLLCAARDIRGFAEIDVAGLAGKVLRVEALIARLRKSDDRTWVSNVAEEFDTALAEAERDEEGR